MSQTNSLYDVLTTIVSQHSRDDAVTLTTVLRNEEVMRLSGGDRHKVSNYLSNLARREKIAKETVDSLGLRSQSNGERFGYYKISTPLKTLVDRPELRISEESDEVCIELKDFTIRITRK